MGSSGVGEGTMISNVMERVDSSVGDYLGRVVQGGAGEGRGDRLAGTQAHLAAAGKAFFSGLSPWRWGELGRWGGAYARPRNRVSLYFGSLNCA